MIVFIIVFIIANDGQTNNNLQYSLAMKYQKYF